MRRTWAFTNHLEREITSHLIANQEAVALFWELEKLVNQFSHYMTPVPLFVTRRYLLVCLVRK